MLGALLTACVGLGVVWILGAVAVHSSGDVRYEVQRSQILSRLNKALPPSGPLLNALARFDPFPRIDGPEARRGAAGEGHRRATREVRAAAASVVKILGTACGLGVEGSGWVAGDGVVVTNAHVVAGQDDTRVLLRGNGAGGSTRPRSRSTRATTSRCCASTGSTRRRCRSPTRPGPGTSAAILGFPRQRAVRRARRRGSGRRARP